MSKQLTPALVDVGGILTETYSRFTYASDEEKTRLGLSAGTAYKASIGIASIPEYVIFSHYGINKGDYVDFHLEHSGCDLKLESIHIDSPNSDVIDFEIHRNGVGKLVDFTLVRNKTPFGFPSLPLKNDLIIRVIAQDAINFVQLVFIPCVILDTFPSGEYTEDSLQA